MAGHSKWNNIKNRKGAVDAERGKIFAQVAKMIRIATKEGKSGDPKHNAQLRTVLEKARSANMPKDKIQKAIDKGLGKSASGSAVQEILYEGFGPAGVAIMVVAHTDNPNRTGGEVRFAFSKYGGSLGGPGSAQYLFHRNAAGEYVPQMQFEVPDAQRGSVILLLAALSDLEDVEDIYISATNIEWGNTTDAG